VSGHHPQNLGGLGRLPPQSVDVEKAIVGAMLIDRRGVERAADLISMDAFYHRSHGLIFDAIVTLHGHQAPVDQITVGEELRRRDQLDEVGGIIYLAELAAGVASAANIEYHIGIVVEKALRREVIEVCTEAAGRAYEDSNAVPELLDWLERQVMAIAASRHTNDPKPLEEVMVATLETIEATHARKQTVTGVDTGFADLNRMTGGLQPGMVTLAGATSSGKSALAIAIATRAALTGTSVFVASFEMSCEELAQRMLASNSGVDLHAMRTGRLTNNDWLPLTRNMGRLAQLPIWIDDTPSMSILELRSKARKLQREHGIGLVVIDYLQLMVGSEDDKKRTREQEVSGISRGLVGLARDLKVPVLALSQLSRAVDSRPDRKPQLSDLRESGSIEHDSHVVLFVYRPGMYGLRGKNGSDLTNTADIIIAKQRNGPKGTVRLMFNAASTTFENLATHIAQDDDHDNDDPDIFA